MALRPLSTRLLLDLLDLFEQSSQAIGDAKGQRLHGIAVLPLYGLVTQRGNMVDDVSGPGSASTQQFSAALRDALNDDTVSQILIDIDSPGGSVYGVAELADEILAARKQKPVVAIANSLAASAAYWIGCSAAELYVTPGGEVGSIGVWQAHFDYSQAMAAEGVSPTLISAGKYKVEGSPYAPLDEEAHGFMQSRVDDYYGTFTKAVARGRGAPLSQVRGGMGQGRVLGADAALAANMVDGIATFDEVIKKMRSQARTNSPVKPRASRLAFAQRMSETMGEARNGLTTVRVFSIIWPCCRSSVQSLVQRASSAAATISAS